MSILLEFEDFTAPCGGSYVCFWQILKSRHCLLWSILYSSEWGFSVGTSGRGSPDHGSTDWVKGIDCSVKLIMIQDFNIWPTLKDKRKKHLFFFFILHYPASLLELLSFLFLFCFSYFYKLALAFKITMWIIGKGGSFYTEVAFSKFI